MAGNHFVQRMDTTGNIVWEQLPTAKQQPSINCTAFTKALPKSIKVRAVVPDTVPVDKLVNDCVTDPDYSYLPDNLYERRIAVPDYIKTVIAILDEIIPSHEYVITGGTARDLALCKADIADLDVCVRNIDIPAISLLVNNGVSGLSSREDRSTRRIRARLNRDGIDKYIDFIATADGAKFAGNFDFTINKVYLCRDLVFRASAQTWLDLDMKVMRQATKDLITPHLVMRSLRLAVKLGFSINPALETALRTTISQEEIPHRAFYTEYQKAIAANCINEYEKMLESFGIPCTHSSYSEMVAAMHPENFYMRYDLEELYEK